MSLGDSNVTYEECTKPTHKGCAGPSGSYCGSVPVILTDKITFNGAAAHPKPVPCAVLATPR